MDYYNIKLVEGVSKDDFIASISIPCNDKLKYFPQILSFHISEEDAAVLEVHPSVEWVEKEMVEEQIDSTRTKTLTSEIQNTSTDGTTFAGQQFYLGMHLPFTNSETNPIGRPNPPGWFTQDNEDRTVENVDITQNYTGQYVDLVCIESMNDLNYSVQEFTDMSAHDNADGTATRYVPMDWGTLEDGTTNSAIDAGTNNQITYTAKTLNYTFSAPPPTEIQITGHGLKQNTRVRYTTTASAPLGGLVSGTVYYLQNVTANSFGLYLLETDNQGNTTVVSQNVTGASSAADGDHIFTPLVVTSHIASAISQITGKDTGFATDATIRWASIADGISTIYNRVLDWHNNKPVNPLTGVRNATITTGGWQYTHVYHLAVEPNTISRIIIPGGTDINAPTDNQGNPDWGTDLSAFADNHIIPRWRNPEWVIPFGPQNANTAFQTVMNAYNQADGIYCVKSAGNSGSVFRKYSDPLKQTSLTMLWPRTYWSGGTTDSRQNWTKRAGFTVYAAANTGTDVSLEQGTRTFAKTIYAIIGETDPIPHEMNATDFATWWAASPYSSQNANWISAASYIEPGANRIVNGASQKGADHAIEVGACQISNSQPHTDGYSCRGPGIDIWSFGRKTWTQSLSGTQYSDGDRYKFFSGTSAAAPICTGMLMIYIDDYFKKRKAYPSIQKLKDLLLKYGDTVEGIQAIDWSNMNYSDMGAYIGSDQDIYGASVYRVTENSSTNGSVQVSELHGSPNKRAALPYNIRLSNGKHIGDPRGPNYGSRTTSGQTYPRRKVRIGS